MPKISYSAEAIQARQQAAYNAWQAQYGQPKPQETTTKISPEQQKVNSTFALPGGEMPKTYTPPQFEVPNADVYMQQDTANIKNLFGQDATEPVYYSGQVRDGLAGTWDAMIANPFKNWARRVWSKINDPRNIIPAPTGEQQQRIDNVTKEVLSSMDTHPFVKKAYDFAEKLTGITPEEIVKTQATMGEATSGGAGETAAAITGTITRTAQQMAGAGIMTAIGAWEWGSRNVSAVAKGLDETADEIAGPDKANWITQGERDIASRFVEENVKKTQPIYVPPGIKPNKADILSKQSETDVAQNMQNIIDFSKTTDSINPVEIFRDGVRLVVNLDKMKPNRLAYNINKNLAGSTAIYSLLMDDAKNAEYERRYAAGENPQKLAYEMQDPLAELAGGILFDPTTVWGFAEARLAKKAIDETGKRIIGKGGIKSAAENAIETGLKDTRMVPEIKNAVENVAKAADGTKPLTMQGALDVIHAAYETSKKEFKKFAEGRNIFHDYTSEGKNSLLANQAKDFMRTLVNRDEIINNPDAMDLVTGAVNASIQFAKKGGDEKAYAALINSPFADRLLSPQGIKFSNMLAGLDEISPLIDQAIKEGNLSKLADAYASQIEKVSRKTILSVEEMRKAGDVVKELENKLRLVDDPKKLKQIEQQLADAKDLAAKYDALPSNVKFMNGLNEVVKKPFTLSMRGFSELYFGLNRFSYPTRNVVAAVPGLAYEFGIKDAFEMATKAITGAQAEKYGQSLLLNIKDEIKALTGVVPEAFNFGPSPVGEFVKGNKKYFRIPGLTEGIRGGGEVAQLSEQLMGAQIMLASIRREMKNALKGGAIPNVKQLVAAGISQDSANLLAKYAYEFNGDARKAVEAFRQTMGIGGEEVWRHLPLPDKMQNFLNTVDPAGRIVKEFDEIRQTAKTAEEFRTKTAELWKKVDAVAESARTVRTNLENSSDLLDYADDAQRATKSIYSKQFKYGTPEAIDNFERIVQGFKNAKTSMTEVTNGLRSWIGDEIAKRGGSTQKYVARFNELMGDTYPAQEAARRAIRKVDDAWETMSSQEIYDTLNNMDDSMFKISKLTNVDPKKVSSREMLRIGWDAYFNWSRQYWANVATAYNEGSIKVLEDMASELGMKLDEVAKMSGVNVQPAIDAYNDAKKLFDESQIDSIVAARRSATKGKTLADIVNGGILQQMDVKGGVKHVFDGINSYRKSMGETAYATINDVPFWEVEDWYRRLKRTAGDVPDLDKVAQEGADLLDPANFKKMEFPPIAPDQAVNPARMIAASPDAKGVYDAFVDATAKQWGVMAPVEGKITSQAEEALGKWASQLSSNIGTVKSEAVDIATATRNSMLYDYRKKLWNVAAQYISPFHYYHASASNQWLQNVAADPKWGAIYADYKEYMERKHAGLPDFWKQNVAISGLPGYDRENPLFFNIEASMNPLYQMIGSDFNDPKRRADWLSTAVDDLSKVIPGIYQPLQWLVAANLYRKGETEAMQRWAGRLVPQTKIIKSVTNKLGIDIPLTKYNELDPFVSILMDGLDPYEESRVVRYLGGLPGVSEEAKVEASNTRSGEFWDMAVRGALGNRAIAEAASYFLGVGYKPRTQQDIETDKFYEDYRKLIAARSIMQPDAYRDSWEALRIKYPFMDTLLIGRKAGEDRDTAYAYNVLGRIPPSEMSDISKFIGIEPYMLESFYDNKGDMSKMLPQDRDRFMAAMVDLSAMLKMPDGATKAEWTQAKKMYQELNKALIEDYGDDIIQKIEYFYSDVADADKTDWLADNPKVKDALNDKTAYLANTPILSAYYGGIDTVARYYNNIMYDTLEKEFGKDIQQKVDTYYDLGDQGLTKEQSAFKKANNLKAYFARQAELQQQANLQAIEAAKFIPEGKDYQIRPEFKPQSGIQTGAMSYTQTDSNAQIAQAIYDQLSPSMKTLLQQYYEGGDLPYAVGKRLEYLGRDYDLSKQEVIRLLGVEK